MSTASQVDEGRAPLVVKIGGAAGVDLDNVCADVAELRRQGERVIVVNGGSEAGDALLASLGMARTEALTASGNVVRLTNEATLRVLTMAWVGDVNKRAVLALLARGVSALGLCGADGRVLVARRRPPLKLQDGERTRIDRSHLAGEISEVNARLLNVLLEAGQTPVVCPPAVTEDGTLVNVDADQVAAAIAAVMGARALVMLSNVAGLLEDPANASTLIRQSDDVEGAMRFARGRMRYKLEAARRALAAGVSAAYVTASGTPRPVLSALAGEVGTKLTSSGKVTHASP
ncbi:[LysW]-aminoadipate kinase [Myxococcus sp. CA051A]|uniref:Acetylglutamate kinase n=1 Tax=Myxococcus llanfairpwllgwyngyllgogerychwyrndrobwllllantysiliogogogochensis TaxID=2590453 RepID=A0A540X313_9BACT|nr:MULTISPECIES: [LysW]-aminoadipate kinase [Myxococcus]NTX15366.1 [LysW]-aminoadipate kinase [Myxococcus sp. CA056]NTX61530.1 [LysW]-aminoadipate kinase [Myxococcus sp. CA051A]TQF15639.1 [LysW]-aminoadipate kinase [Myxococcus llanfairpwllgwyngyllgogerychwyrndrobwllllantysiliogogogochensis]